MGFFSALSFSISTGSFILAIVVANVSSPTFIDNSLSATYVFIFPPVISSTAPLADFIVLFLISSALFVTVSFIFPSPTSP